jgi:hypothetical protein
MAMPPRVFVLAGGVALSIGVSSAWAQIVVTDPATTTRNAVTATLKSRVLEVANAQYERLQRMARRLSADTRLDKYALANPPQWWMRAPETVYAGGYENALRTGDPWGVEYTRISRSRQPVADLLGRLSPVAREVFAHALATLDAADSTLILSTHQAGMLRSAGLRETAAIDRLEADVLDPSQEQSTTAILDKISGALLLDARQNQARLEVLAGIVEQLLVDNKRARDTETAALNMQLGRLRADWAGENRGFLAGAARDLRTWRQP